MRFTKRRPDAIGSSRRRLAMQMALLGLLFLQIPLGRAQVVPVTVGGNSIGEAAGVLIAKNGACAVLTAGHAVNDAVELTVTLGDQRFRAQVDWNGLRASDAVDVAVLKLLSDVKEVCPPLAEAKTIESALAQPFGQIWLLAGRTEVTTLGVSILRRNQKEIRLRLTDGAQSPAPKGVSGAAVVFAGTVVGVVSENDEVGLRAVRLDYVLRNAGQQLGIRPVDQIKVAKNIPYDTSVLPAAILAEVERARETRVKAEQVAEAAKAVAALCDEAEQFAKSIPLGQYQAGHSRFATESGGFYAGQVFYKSNFFGGSSMSAAGYGVRREQSQQYQGDVKRCKFKDGTGCTGPTTVDFGARDTSWRKLEIGTSSRPQGPAKILTRSGATIFGNVESRETEGGAALSYALAGSGVMLLSDGRQYEGQLGGAGNGHGVGVLWNSDGTLNRMGRWRDGNAVDE